MSMKKTNALMTIAMAMAVGTGAPSYDTERIRISPEERRRRKSKAQKAINKRRGLTEFKYGDKSVWALNKKNADRKAKAKGYL